MASNFLFKLLLWPMKQFYVTIRKYLVRMLNRIFQNKLFLCIYLKITILIANVFMISIYFILEIMIGCNDLQEYEEINRVHKFNKNFIAP